VGTDELFAVAKEAPGFGRSAMARLVTELWLGRGAALVGSRWTKRALWGREDQERFGVALSPPSARGWVTIVESAEYSVSIDQELLDRLGARTSTWLCWSLDHAGLYGQRRVSKRPPTDPVDLGDGAAYASLRGASGWAFLTFEGVCPSSFRRFAPTARTKKDSLPRDAAEELESSFIGAVQRLDVEAAIGVVETLGARVSDFAVGMVFDTSYPIEWPETASGVAAIGAAVAERRALPAEAWVRLLEVAAVQNDADGRRRAEVGLASCRPAGIAAAIEEASARFRARRQKAATQRFASWSKAFVGKPRRQERRSTRSR
jgi:hypothetical protein